jgi:hypothetical protein
VKVAAAAIVTFPNLVAPWIVGMRCLRARYAAARAIHKSEDWPPNVVSIAEARAQRREERGLAGDDREKGRRL